MYRNPESKAEEHLEAFYRLLYAKIGYFPESYVAGGAIASLILEQSVNDYDIWFTTLGTKHSWMDDADDSEWSDDGFQPGTDGDLS